MSFGVRELTAEILEAGIIVQGCSKGLNLGLHIVSRGGPFPNGAGTLKRRKGQGEQMCRAGLRKAL